ncbi:MAG: hypothetical protein KatS3mg032_2337 [Cyclobacteriaceae bacterium]|nr:MAG: hypothetical protein KatS3mg032_2337 [Cyclobacteriaceae bacterium]
MKILFYFLICLALCVRAQEPVSGSYSKLNDQYQRLQDHVEVVEGYRMVRMLDVERLWKSVNDSLRIGEAVRRQMSSDITRLRDSVANLNLQLTKARQREAELQGTIQSISVLGFQFNKSFYRLLSLGIIAGLLAVNSCTGGNGKITS